MNRNHHGLYYEFTGNPAPPHPHSHRGLSLNGFNTGFPHTHLQTGPISIHPGTGILPIDQIPVFADFDLPLDADLSSPIGVRPGKPRRRRTAEGDVIKHRRTRNGCYTCRSRRIKCDEGRPICERCKKGSRDCVYPDAPPPKSKNKSTNNSHSPTSKSPSPKSPPSAIEDPMRVDKDEAEGSIISGDALFETEEGLNAKEGSPASTVSHSGFKDKERSDSGSIFSQRRRRLTNAAKKVSFDEGIPLHASPTSIGAGVFTERSSDSGSLHDSPNSREDDLLYCELQPDLRDLMRYHHAHIGFHHYFFRQDATQFVQDLLPTAALAYQPLLHAVCGFAAYHRAVARDGKIEEFLSYYHKAVTLLLNAIKSGEEHTESTLMTVLQLATFEEYLGDWVNLMGHLTAAKEVMHKLFTPKTMVETETRRKIFSWLSRFDIFAGMASGHTISIEAEWFREMERWHYQARSMDPSSVDLQIRWLVSHMRVLSIVLTELTSKAATGQIDRCEFAKQYKDLMKQQAAWGQHLIPLTKLAASKEPLPDLRSICPIEDESANQWPADLFRADSLYLDNAWAVNLLVIDLYSTMALQYATYARIMGQPEGLRDTMTMVKDEVRILQAMLKSSSMAEAGVLCVQAALGLLAIFLKDAEPEYREWCRDKLAKLEDCGYSYPPLFRSRLADAWSEPTLVDWWIPPGRPGHQPRPIIRALRAFNKDREFEPRDQHALDMRNLRGLFGLQVPAAHIGGKPNTARNTNGVETEAGRMTHSQGRGRGHGETRVSVNDNVNDTGPGTRHIEGHDHHHYGGTPNADVEDEDMQAWDLDLQVQRHHEEDDLQMALEGLNGESDHDFGGVLTQFRAIQDLG